MAHDHASGDAARGAALGLLAAVLFGLSTPLAKLLLPGSAPLMLAGLLYLGGGIGLSLLSITRAWSRTASREAALRWSDAPLLVGIVVAGGIAGPVLMLTGLRRLTGVVTSLLLNLEAPFTILLAVLVFREHLSRRELIGAGLIIVGAATLGFQPGSVHLDGWGILALTGACLCWALDNNLTQRLSTRDPVAVVRIKALAAGSCNLIAGLAVGNHVPSSSILVWALVLGAFSYGASILLDMYALRFIGAAREAVYFATAPFMGALGGVLILRERLSSWDLAAGAVMALGVLVLIRARHGHLHEHAALEHDHLHVHDEHHRHHHDEPVEEPHSHPHVHAPLVHDHPHVSDLHHRHEH